MDLKSQEIVLYILIILLQIADWYTTKISISFNGSIAEANPFAEKSFQKEGINRKHLVIKILAGLYFVCLLAFKIVPRDFLIGLSFWLMLYVVLNNTFSLLSDYTLMKLGTWKPLKNKTTEELLEHFTRHSIRQFFFATFLFSIGGWVYFMNKRTDILWTAVGNMILSPLVGYRAYQYSKKLHRQNPQFV